MGNWSRQTSSCVAFPLLCATLFNLAQLGNERENSVSALTENALIYAKVFYTANITFSHFLYHVHLLLCQEVINFHLTSVALILNLDANLKITCAYKLTIRREQKMRQGRVLPSFSIELCNKHNEGPSKLCT